MTMCRFTIFALLLSVVACTKNVVASNDLEGESWSAQTPNLASIIIQEQSTTTEPSATTTKITMIPEEGVTQEIVTPDHQGRTPGDPCTNDNVMFVEDGQTLFHCLNNSLAIFGCKLTSGAILADGDTIVQDHYLLQCQINDQKEAANAVQIACHVDDRILGPGQTYVEGNEYFTCTWRNETNDLLLAKSGCVDHEGNKIKEGDSIVNGYYQYKCQAMLDDPGTISMRFVRDGCAFENYPYKPGQIVIIGDYWYTCEQSNTENTPKDQSSQCSGQQHQTTITTIDYAIKPRGCIVDFGFLDVGEIFHKKGYVYKCEASNNNNPAIAIATEKNDLPADWPFAQVRRTMIGCLEMTPKMTIVEHFPGDQWLESSKSDPSQKYMVECSVNQQQRQLVKTPVQCYLDEVDGKKLVEPKTLKPGCMARTINALWTCGKMNNNGKDEHQISSKVLVNAGLSDTIFALMSGYAFCN